MKQLTKEQYDILVPFEETLHEAISGSYRAFLLSDAVRLNQIYFELTGDSQNVTCGRCLLMMLRTLAQAKAEYEAIPAPEPTPAPTPATTSGSKKKKKTT